MTHKIWTDQGGGITHDSVEMFKSLKGQLGEIYSIAICQDVSFGFQIHCENGFVLLSGCNCGYAGTGPHGSVEILKLLNYPIDLSHKIFSNNHVHVTDMFARW